MSVIHWELKEQRGFFRENKLDSPTQRTSMRLCASNAQKVLVPSVFALSRFYRKCLCNGTTARGAVSHYSTARFHHRSSLGNSRSVACNQKKELWTESDTHGTNGGRHLCVERPPEMKHKPASYQATASKRRYYEL